MPLASLVILIGAAACRTEVANGSSSRVSSSDETFTPACMALWTPAELQAAAAGDAAGVADRADLLRGNGGGMALATPPSAVGGAEEIPTDRAGNSGLLAGWKATRYGESYNGQQLGCPDSGLYSSANPAIVAVGPSHYLDTPCGTALTVCGAAGCIAGFRVDACPGCLGDWIDLSESGVAAVCGVGVGGCAVSVTPR